MKKHDVLSKDPSNCTASGPAASNVISSTELVTNANIPTQFNQAGPIGTFAIARTKSQTHSNFENASSVSMNGYYSGIHKPEYFNKADFGYNQYSKSVPSNQFVTQNAIGQKHELTSSINVKNFCSRLHSDGPRGHPQHDGFTHQNPHYYAGELGGAQPNASFSSAQCYHNEYDSVQAELNSSYSQSYYYEGASYHHHHHHNAIGPANLHPPMEYQPNSSFSSTENSESYNFHQSYYDTPTINTSFPHGANNNNTTNIIELNHQQLGHDVYATHSSMPVNYGPNNVNLVGNNSNTNITHMENSNSSSDFNFLSNLANDFAPEYYQLS